jgi:hypothetical protein
VTLLLRITAIAIATLQLDTQGDKFLFSLLWLFSQ